MGKMEKYRKQKTINNGKKIILPGNSVDKSKIMSV